MGSQHGQRPGFDHSASFVGQGVYQDCPFEIDGVPTPTRGWIDDVSTDYAIAWMKANRDRPFSAVVGFKSPHTPRGGENLPPRLRDRYAGETSRPAPNMGSPAVYHGPPPPGGAKPHRRAGNDVHLDYLRHLTGADENLGRLLDALDALGLAEDTVVVYASDNGYFLGEHGLGDKRALYDESLRVPLLVRYPRLFPAGRVVDEMVLNIDLAPTLLDLAGVAAPAAMQGANWKALAAGEKPTAWRRAFLAEYYRELGDTPTCVGIRTSGGKLVSYAGHPEWTEVFDLSADPYERNNLAGDPAAVSGFGAELDMHARAVGYTPGPQLERRLRR